MTINEMHFRDRIARIGRLYRIEQIQEVQKEEKTRRVEPVEKYAKEEGIEDFPKAEIKRQMQNKNYNDIMPSIDGVRKSIVNFQNNTKDIDEEER